MSITLHQLPHLLTYSRPGMALQWLEGIEPVITFFLPGTGPFASVPTLKDK